MIFSPSPLELASSVSACHPIGSSPSLQVPLPAAQEKEVTRGSVPVPLAEGRNQTPRWRQRRRSGWLRTRRRRSRRQRLPSAIASTSDTPPRPSPRQPGPPGVPSPEDGWTSPASNSCAGGAPIMCKASSAVSRQLAARHAVRPPSGPPTALSESRGLGGPERKSVPQEGAPVGCSCN